MDPSYEWAHLILGQAYEQKKVNIIWHSVSCKKAVELSHNSPLMVSALAHAYAYLRKPRRSSEVIGTTHINQSHRQYVSPYYIAIVYLGLGKNDLAMTWLEKGVGGSFQWAWCLPRVEPETRPAAVPILALLP